MKDKLEQLQSRIQYHFEDLKFYIRTLDEKNKAHLEQVHNNIEKAVPVQIGDFTVTPEVQYEESLRLYGHINSKFHLSSAFVTAYSLFEYFFKEICGLNYVNTKIRVDHLKLQGIMACKFYIESVMNLDHRSIDEIWIKIDKHRILRNAIVHDFSVVSESKDFFKTENLQKNFPEVVYDGYFYEEGGNVQLYISDSIFVHNFCDLAVDYLKKVIEKIE